MIKTRDDLKQYARSVCVTQLEKAAANHENGEIPTVIDSMGYIPTFLEEFCRPFWGIAPVIAEGNKTFSLEINGRSVPLQEWLSDILFEGLSENSEKSWERFRNRGAGWGLDFQNLTELAGLLTGMFFCREKTWDLFSEERRGLFADKIFSFCRSECEHTAENNHIWFPLFCLLVLKKFGYCYPETDSLIKTGLDELEKMYLSDGWYSDGIFGRFDYYSVWSMHAYPLLWCLIEDASFQDYNIYRSRYIERTEQFISQYVYCFDSECAYPAFGRSLAYKYAAVSIFPLAALAGCRMDYGLARKITLGNINYFAENMQLNPDGTLPAGYLYNAPGLLENYTCDGGTYWCTKSFLCLLMKEDHLFWISDDSALPVEKGGFLVAPANRDINFILSGTKECGVTVYNNISQYYQNGIYNNPFNDMAAYYCKFAYNSKSGFAIGTRDRTSFDSMISLQTPDRSMSSHRWGFSNHGRKGSILLSSHIPFSNDSETVIETAVLPFEDGSHVRLHRVTLSREYIVREGGFSIGLWNDYHTNIKGENSLSIENGKLCSYIKAEATVPIYFSEKNPQPGLHILAPQACYPCFSTDILTPGTYIFASAYRISTERTDKLPCLELRSDSLYIENNGETAEIPFSLLKK